MSSKELVGVLLWVLAGAYICRMVGGLWAMSLYLLVIGGSGLLLWVLYEG